MNDEYKEILKSLITTKVKDTMNGIEISMYINNEFAGKLLIQILCDYKINLYGLFVEPKFRNKRIATLLNEKAIEIMSKNKTYGILVCNTNNKYVKSILNKLGFNSIPFKYNDMFYKEISVCIS